MGRGMGTLVAIHSVCLAEYEVFMAIAVVSLALIAYLSWSNFREKREWRREERAPEQRRRAHEAAGPQT